MTAGLSTLRLRVHLQPAGDAGDVGGRERVAQLRPVGRLGARDRVGEHLDRVVGERGDRVGLAVELRAVGLDEVLDDRIGVVAGVVVRDEGVVERLAAVLERVADPAVAAENRHLHAELARLARDDRRLRVVAGREDRVRLLAADLRQDGLEVGVARAVAHRRRAPVPPSAVKCFAIESVRPTE